MLLRIENRKSRCKTGKNVAILKCDQCYSEFERSISNSRTLLHFCSHACAGLSRSIGKLKEKSQATCIEKYGHTTPPSLRNWLIKQGVTNSSQLPNHNEKVRKTSLERYGTEHPKQSSIVKEKTIATNRERYGRDHYMGSDEFLEKTKTTNQRNLGVDWPCQHPDYQKEKNIDWEQARVKRHETMKKNGSFKKSEPEDIMYEQLCDELGEDDIQRQIMMNSRWPIDFYIRSLDVYVQYDSYWHGYDCDGRLRDLGEVTEFKNRRDKQIHVKMLIDIAQNKWFKEQNLTLIRIICDEYKTTNYVEKLRRSSKIVSEIRY